MDDDGVDVDKPSPARIYDYWLGGSHNFAVDREMARRLIKDNPRTEDIVRANRAFLRRAVRCLVDHGIRQFLDIGSGIPTVGNVHEIAQHADPSCRIVYVDRDFVAVKHSERLLRDNPGATVVRADARQPAEIIAHPGVRELIDFSQPIGVLMVAVLHFVTDEEHPERIVGEFRRVAAPGSMLVLSHGALDGNNAEGRLASSHYNQGVQSFVLRTREELEPWFDGFQLLEPGLVRLPMWRPANEPQWWDTASSPFPAWGGVGRVPD